MASAKAVAAAISYMGEPESRRVGGTSGKQRDEGGAHPGEMPRAAGLPVDGLIGGIDGSGEASLGLSGKAPVRGGRGEVGEEGFGGEMAGDFAGGGSAYAVADDEGSDLRRGGAGVLVTAANEARVRQHGVDESVRRHDGG